MNCIILHESKGRIRVHIKCTRMSIPEADCLASYLDAAEIVHRATVYERTCDVVIYYHGRREDVIRLLRNYRPDARALAAVEPHNSGRMINRIYQEKLVNATLFKALRMLFLPAPLKIAHTIFTSTRYLWKGAQCLFRHKLEVEVLDALSIGISIFRADYGTADSVMFLLRIGDLMEEMDTKEVIG